VPTPDRSEYRIYCPPDRLKVLEVDDTKQCSTSVPYALRALDEKVGNWITGSSDIFGISLG